MNKFMKLMLTSAVLVTTGMASTIADFQDGGVVEAGAVIEFKDQELTLTQDKFLDVYGSLTGTGIINCSGNGKVNVYGSIYKQNDANADAIKTAVAIGSITAVHTIDETNKGSIADTITVTPPEALNKTDADLAVYASGLGATDLVYVANSEGTETKCVGGTGEATTIPAALANAATDSAIEGLTPTSLLMENKLKFTGNNSGFNQKAVRIGTTETPADVEYAGENSAFLAETTVESGSKLTISSPEGVTLTKDLTVNGSSSFKLNENQDEIIKDIKNGRLIVTGKLIIGPGTTLTLGKEMFSPIAENPSDYPKVMTWPVGSFSNTLTELNKNYYTVSFNDGSSLKFYYDEDGKRWDQVYDETNPGEMMHMMFNQTEDGGLEIRLMGLRKEISITDIDSLPSRTEAGKTYYTVSFGYDQSVEIYEDPANPGQYKTDSAGGWMIDVYGDKININCHMGSDSPIKSLTAEEVSALPLDKKELIYATDGTFSYTYDSENQSWVLIPMTLRTRVGCVIDKICLFLQRNL